MLRETRARLLATGTAVLLVLLAAVFAWLRNSVPPPGPAARALATDAQFERGRRAFHRLGCTDCHALDGVGNPGNPLDGVGLRMDRESIRDWATGAGVARAELPAGVARRKARAATDPELDALVDYVFQRTDGSRVRQGE